MEDPDDLPQIFQVTQDIYRKEKKQGNSTQETLDPEYGLQ